MDLIKYLAGESQTLLNAPILACILIVVGFFAGRWYYIRAITSQKSEISLLKTQKADLESRLTNYGKGSELLSDENRLVNAESQETNIPDHFPSLNEAALKKHVALAASHCPFEKHINHIYLFEGTPFRYQLVVIGKNTKDFGGVKNYWDRPPSDIFESHFKEVYRKEPPQDFWSEWGTVVVISLDEIPDNLALKKCKWALY